MISEKKKLNLKIGFFPEFWLKLNRIWTKIYFPLFSTFNTYMLWYNIPCSYLLTYLRRYIEMLMFLKKGIWFDWYGIYEIFLKVSFRWSDLIDPMWKPDVTRPVVTGQFLFAIHNRILLKYIPTYVRTYIMIDVHDGHKTKLIILLDS